MAEAAEKLNITDLTVFFGGSYAIGVARNCLNGYLAARLDKAINRCLQGFQAMGGGLNSAFCKLFAIFSFNTRNAPCAKVYKFNKGGLLDRNMLKYRLLRRFL